MDTDDDSGASAAAGPSDPPANIIRFGERDAEDRSRLNLIFSRLEDVQKVLLAEPHFRKNRALLQSRMEVRE